MQHFYADGHAATGNSRFISLFRRSAITIRELPLNSLVLGIMYRRDRAWKEKNFRKDHADSNPIKKAAAHICTAAAYAQLFIGIPGSGGSFTFRHPRDPPFVARFLT
jgi:hypothetical protein